MNTFSVGAAIRFAWEIFKKRPWIFIGTALTIFVVNLLVEAFVGSFEESALEIVGVIISFASSTLIGLGMTAFFLKAHDAVESVDIKELWHPQDFWKYLGTTILNGLAVGVLFIPFVIALIVTIGMTTLSTTANAAEIIAGLGAVTIGLLLLSVILGVYVSSMLMFSTYTVVDRALGPIAALKESIKITKGNRLKIIGLLLALLLLNLVGVLALFVGLLVTVPMTLIAIVHVYRTLSPRQPATV